MAEMAVRRKELQNAESRKSNVGNGLIEGMADRMVEWQTEMATYVLFMVHTDDDDDDDNDDDDTLIFYSIDKWMSGVGCSFFFVMGGVGGLIPTPIEMYLIST